jgi:hypothetical protein
MIVKVIIARIIVITGGPIRVRGKTGRNSGWRDVSAHQRRIRSGPTITVDRPAIGVIAPDWGGLFGEIPVVTHTCHL